MTTYINPFGGDTIYPSVVSYQAISFFGQYDLQWPVNGNNETPVSGIIDATATQASSTISLPPANQVSTGQSILIRNVGVDTFEVQTNTGAAITTIAAGVAKYIFLTSNTTIAGTWSAITFGAGTSQADAASLAGRGLLALDSVLNQSYPVQNYSSDFTYTASNRADFTVWEGGVGIITLPSASLVGNSWFVNLRNNGTGIVTLTPQGTDTVDDNAAQQLQPTESLVLVSNGSTGFNTFGYGRSNAFAYTQLTLAVSGGTYTLSSSQASNTIQAYTGVLSNNQIIIVPPTVQLYSFTNVTSGPFTLTFATGIPGANTVTVPQGTSVIAVCDGTNVYNANTAITGTFSSATLDPGSVVAPSLNFLNNLDTGFYLAGPGIVGISANGVSAATFSSTGVNFPVGISGGVF